MTTTIEEPGVGLVSDDELAAQALAADPDAPVGEHAVPLASVVGAGGLLPDWYMPAPMGGAGLLRGWRRRVAILVVVSFLAVLAYGLCSTYGAVVVA